MWYTSITTTMITGPDMFISILFTHPLTGIITLIGFVRTGGIMTPGGGIPIRILGIIMQADGGDGRITEDTHIMIRTSRIITDTIIPIIPMGTLETHKDLHSSLLGPGNQ